MCGRPPAQKRRPRIGCLFNACNVWILGLSYAHDEAITCSVAIQGLRTPCYGRPSAASELAPGADEFGNSLSMASAPVVRTGRSSRL
jgi:hypothetical protein